MAFAGIRVSAMIRGDDQQPVLIVFMLTFLRGIPNQPYLLVHELKSDRKLRAVLPFGGLTSQRMRARIEAGFRAPFRNCYGTSELGPVAVFGRHGLRSVLLLMGLSVLFALMSIAPFSRDAAGTAIVATVTLGALAFLAPVRGAHRHLREARDAELTRVRDAIRERRLFAGFADSIRWPCG